MLDSSESTTVRFYYFKQELVAHVGATRCSFGTYGS
jgi:hypothetical protein